jgi:protein O-GlcNAc transferase
MSRISTKAALDAAIRTFQSGQLPQAKLAFEQVLRLDPKEPDALHSLGLILFQLGEQEKGVQLVTQSTKVRPRHPETHYNLGIMHQRRGQAVLAESSFRQVLALKSNHAQAHFALGNTLKELGKGDDAVKSFEQAVKLVPSWPEGHFNLGNALRDIGEFERGAACFQKAIALKPDWADAYVNLAGYPLRTGLDQEETFALLERAIALQPDGLIAHESLLFNRQYSAALTSVQWRATLRAFADVYFAPLNIPNLLNLKEPQKRLRIGYVSPDFRNHSCSWFIEPVLANHDQNNVGVYIYANVPQADEVTARLKSLSPHW